MSFIKFNFAQNDIIFFLIRETRRKEKLMAERQGFEPWVSCDTTVFKTVPFDHSGISPYI